ncbi:MAG: TIM-barrel domain-containing protein [Thermoplasmata archaeon]
MVKISTDKKLLYFKEIFGSDIAKDSVDYTILKDNIDSKYPIPRHKTYSIAGPISDFKVTGNSIQVFFMNGRMVLSIAQKDTIRVLWGTGNEPPEPDNGYRFDDVKFDSGKLVIVSKDIRIEISDKVDYFYRNELLRSEFLPDIGSHLTLRAKIREDSIINGTGERSLPLNLRNRKVSLWNHDAGGSYGDGTDPLYINIPILLDIKNDFCYSVFFNNSSKATFDICSKEKDSVRTKFTGGRLDYIMTFGSLKDISRQMSNILGKPLLPPKWALGYHQSRYSYNSQAEVEEVFAKFQEMELPLSAIHLDINYMDGFRVFTVNKEKFPDLKGLSERMNQSEVKLVAILDPGVKSDNNFSVYNEGVKGSHFIRDPEGNVIKGPVWPGNAAFPDFSDERTREWWAGKYTFFKENGITGVWHDMNEPAIFVIWGDNSLPLMAVQKEGFHYLVHNKYGLQMSMSGYDGLSRIMDDRPFILSRSGWAGIQKYAFVWTGDTASSWKVLKQTIPTILNLGLSGIPFSGVDIGGFSGNPSEELFLRWFELGSLLPLFRNHSAKGTKRREPWVFSKTGQEVIRKYLKMRYMMIPYLLSVSYESHTVGYPFVRPLYMEFPGLYSDEAFMIGGSLLAVPVLKKGLKQISINLPKGKWYYFWDNTICEGSIDVNVSLEDLPLFVREGSIIPLERGGKEFHVYPGNLERFVFYDDDSKNNPTFIKVEFKMKEVNDSFTIDWNYDGNLYDAETEINFVIHKEKTEEKVTCRLQDRTLSFIQ